MSKIPDSYVSYLPPVTDTIDMVYTEDKQSPMLNYTSPIVRGVVAVTLIAVVVGSFMYLSRRTSPWLDNGDNIYFTKGNVGIGTNDPATKLHVRSDQFEVLRLSTSNAAGPQLALHNDTNVAVFAFIKNDFDGDGSIRENALEISNIGSDGKIHFMSGGGDTGNPHMVIAPGGRVGIGTNNPAAKLEVYDGADDYARIQGGRMEILGGSSNADLRIISEVGFGNIGVANNQGLSFATNATERMRITPSGNVGIGTNSPGYKLDVNGDVRIRNSIYVNDTTPISLVNYDAGRIETVPAETNAATKMIFKTGQGVYTNMTMVGGNVGIGTNDPATKLHVRSDQFEVLRLSTSNAAGPQLALHNDTNVAVFAFIKNDFDGDGSIRENALEISNTGSGGKIHFMSGGGDTGNPHMVIAPGGNVGIGTNSTGYKLDVNGDVRIRNSIYVNDTTPISLVNYDAGRIETVPAETNAATKMVFKTGQGVYTNMTMVGGNVGIGTNDPATKLHVRSDQFEVLRLSTSNAAGPQLALHNDTNVVSFMFIKNDFDGDGSIRENALEISNTGSGGKIHFMSGGGDTGNPHMVIAPGGNVGIGTATPDSNIRLQVKGWIASTFADGSPRFIFAANDTGVTGSEFGGYIGRKYNSVSPNTQLYTFGNLTGEEAHAFNNPDNSRLMTIKTSGRVGIGTTNPQFPLDVRATATGFANGYTWSSGNGFNGPYTELGIQTSIFGQDVIMSGGGFAVSSDERIKKDLTPIEDSVALNQLRLVQPSTYKYRDFIKRGDETVIGFSAQQVREVIPLAVGLDSDFIPDYYDFVDVVETNIIKLGKTYTINETEKIRIIDEIGSQIDCTVKTVTTDSTGFHVVEIDKTIECTTGKIFFFGRLVNDFHRLRKDYLFTINVAATQELDRKVQSLETEKTILHSELQALSTEKESLKTRLTASETEVSGLRSELQALRDVLREKGVIE